MNVTCSISSYGDVVYNRYIGIEINGLTLEDVMNKALLFDFNKHKKTGDQTFESKFMSKTTNNLGNLMMPAAIEVIMLQFRKFMAMMAYNMMINKEACLDIYNYTLQIDTIGRNQQMNLTKINCLGFYENIYIPIEIIDQVWRALILSTRIYREFCYELCGAFIDRISCNGNQKAKSKQIDFNNFVSSNENVFKPYRMLWYDFSTNTDKNCIYVKNSELNDITKQIDKIVMTCKEEPNFKKTDEFCKSIYNSILKRNNGIFDEESWLNSNFKSDAYEKYPAFFSILLNFEFPNSLLNSFTRSYCLSESGGVLIMIEYLKFLAFTI